MNPIQALADRIESQNLWEKEITIARNEYVNMADTTDTNLYYIVSGSLHIFLDDGEKQHTIRLGYQDNFIASLDSFISEQPSELYIQAIKKCQLKVITKAAFMEMVHSDADLFAVWFSLLEQMIFQQMEREKDLLIASPQERYRRVWERSPQLFQYIPNKYIASYLRMTPETLSRIKKKNAEYS